MSNADKAREIVAAWDRQFDHNAIGVIALSDLGRRIAAALDAKDEKLRKAREALEWIATPAIAVGAHDAMLSESLHDIARAALAEMGDER